jgi:abhydrolase domain-containing protein 11
MSGVSILNPISQIPIIICRTAYYSSARPPLQPRYTDNTGNGNSTTQSSSGSSHTPLIPVNLAYRALETRRGEEKKTKKKSTVIIHHSLLARKENWNPISEIINHTTHRKVVNVDARNHGESPHTNDMSLPLMASDITHLTKQMPIPGKISFIGHSMGGRVGIQLALTHPELIDKLIVVDSAIFVNENVKERWRKLRNACYALVDIQHQLWEVQGYERMGLANKAIENIITCKKDRANLLSNLILSDQPNADSLWRVNLQNYLAKPDHQMILRNGQNGNGNSKFEGQALFISGDRSKFTGKEDEEEIREVIPNAEFVWLKDCGHLLHVEKQKEFCERVVSFLEKNN